MAGSIKLNGWSKIIVIIIGLGTHAIYIADRTGQDHQSIKDLRSGQNQMSGDIRAMEGRIDKLRDQLRDDIKTGMGDRWTKADETGSNEQHNGRMDRIENKIDDHIRDDPQ